MSNNLTIKDLYSLEQYSEKRAAFREKVMKHKEARRIALGPNLTRILRKQDDYSVSSSRNVANRKDF